VQPPNDEDGQRDKVIDRLTTVLKPCTAVRMPASPAPSQIPKLRMMQSMNTARRSLLLGLAALALAGCASKPDLSSIQDPEVDFHAYRTFAFFPGQPEGSLIDRRLLAAARSQLERRGYVFDELAPDMLVHLAAAMEERQGLRATPGHFPGSEGIETEDYRLGRLAIDLVDVSRRQVVWHGSAEGRVSPAMLRNVGTAVEEAVAAVFEGFPVRADTSAAPAAPKAR
jgi:hypothetical protein